MSIGKEQNRETENAQRVITERDRNRDRER